MSNLWPTEPLATMLTPVERSERVKPDKLYRLLGAHWYAKGLYIKETKPGSEVQADRLYSVALGDFVYNRLFGWKGSFAVVAAEHDGCYVSGEFPCFQIETRRVEPGFLRWYFSQAATWDEALSLSTGGTPTSRNRLKEDKLLGMCIPLPPLEEQRRIVAVIERLAAKIEEARGLQRARAESLERLLVATAHRNDLTENEKVANGWKRVRLGQVMAQVSSPVTVDAITSYPNLGIYSFGRGLFQKEPISGSATSAPTLYRVHSGQFIYSRLFAFEGAYGVVTADFDGYFVSGEYPTFELDASEVIPEFLWAYFRSPTVWAQLASKSKGVGHRRQRVHAETVLAHSVMLPPLESQLQIRATEARVDQLRAPQRETAAQLDALLPAVLDRAFRGEL